MWCPVFEYLIHVSIARKVLREKVHLDPPRELTELPPNKISVFDPLRENWIVSNTMDVLLLIWMEWMCFEYFKYFFSCCSIWNMEAIGIRSPLASNNLRYLDICVNDV